MSGSGSVRSVGRERKDDGKVLAVNRSASHDYKIEKKIECGLVLSGSEVKSCKDSKIQLKDSYASFERHELYLYKVHIAEYRQSGPHYNHMPTQKRKLLIHRRELKVLEVATEKDGYTLVPLRFYLKRGRVKVELGIAKGKTKGDKRESQKTHEAQREVARATRQDRRSSSGYSDD